MSIAAKMRDRWPEMRKSKARQVSTNDIGIQTIVFVLYLCCIVCKWRPMTSTSRQLSTQHLRIHQAAIAEMEIKGEAGRQREAMSFLFPCVPTLFLKGERWRELDENVFTLLRREWEWAASTTNDFRGQWCKIRPPVGVLCPNFGQNFDRNN